MNTASRKQLALSLAPPLAALVLQSLFWRYLQPFVWFLFYPAVFLSSWIGGRPGGLLATLLSAVLVIFFFIPPRGSWILNDPKYFLTTGVFLVMGGLFSQFHGRLRRVNDRAAQARGTIRANVAERQRAEEAQARLAAIVQSSDDAIIGKTLTGIITTWNKGAEKIFGYSAAEAVGKPMLMLIPPERASEEPQILARIARGERVEHFETIRIRKDGRRINASVTISPVRDSTGKIIGVSKIARDITERKEAEALAQAVTGAAVGTWHWNIVTNELRWSDRCREIFGVPPGEPLNYQRFLAALHSDDREPTDQAGQKALAGRTEFEAEYRIIWPDGSAHWAIARGRGYYAAEGQPVRMEGVVLDITARKQAEAELAKLYADLKLRAAQLDEANRELEAFSHSVSHDLRAPLRHITGFVHLLGRDTAAYLPAASLRHLKIIADATKRMGTLIDDLLAFSQVGRAELRKTTVDLAPLVREISGELAAEVPDRQILWKINDLPFVTADRALLRLVLVNLISNAVKFTGTRAEAVIEMGEIAGPPPVIFIRDNGVGFDPAYAHKLFGVFQRLHSTAEFEGTGIGLANVQRIIRRHGGEAWAEGAVEGGATFYFSLPK